MMQAIFLWPKDSKWFVAIAAEKIVDNDNVHRNERFILRNHGKRDIIIDDVFQCGHAVMIFNSGCKNDTVHAFLLEN